MRGYNQLLIRRCLTIKVIEVLNESNTGRLNRELLIKKLNESEAGKKIGPCEILLKYLKITRILKSEILNFAPRHMRILLQFSVITYDYEKNRIEYGILDEIRPSGNGFLLVGPSKIFIHKTRLPGNNFRYLPRLNCWQNHTLKRKLAPDSGELLRLQITDIMPGEHQYAHLKIKGSLKIPYGGAPHWY